MSTEQLLFWLRAACRPWVMLDVGEYWTRRSMLSMLAGDLARFVNNASSALLACRTMLVAQPILTPVDISVFVVLEIALARLLPRPQLVQAAAFDATFIAIQQSNPSADIDGVGLLAVYHHEVLDDAALQLRASVLLDNPPEIAERAQQLLALAADLVRRSSATG